ncbi:MAG TPA: LysM peptidoglycan-binding domain-containing protein [Bacteroidetes bacterium]|nr:LysM peptidoglycan-binding domain-containing protein [Bacteroidota bacterium]
MKKFLPVFVLLFSSLLLSAQVRVFVSDSINQRDGKKYYIHFVKQGQTVYSIAKAYNMSVEEIYYENPEAKAGVNVDQVLWIPVVNKETELNREVKKTGFPFFYHLAKDNQDYRWLASLYHVPESSIRQANPGVSEPFRDGEYIKIPVLTGLESIAGKGENEEISFNPELKVIPGFRHVVNAGETEYSIAKRYNVTVGRLRAVNPLLANGLNIGDRLRIPEVAGGSGLTTEEQQEIAAQQPGFYKHKVKKRETLYSISRLYGVEIQDIYTANPGLTPALSIGQVIKIPKAQIKKPYIIYVASKKIKLNKVAKMYKVPLSRLHSENPSLGKRVYAGQRIRVPVGEMALKYLKEKEKEETTGGITEKEYEKPPALPTGCRKIKPHPQKVFKVALMIPFFMEETDSLDVGKFLLEKEDNFKPFRFIEFYEGALMAVDSLKEMGMNIQLYVYDVDKNLTKTARVLQNPVLKTMDLIIGPFYSYSFAQVALFAATFNIPIVNPLSYREQILEDYPTAIKVKPGKQFQADELPALLKQYYPGYKVFLIAHTAYKDADLVTNLANKISAGLQPTVKVSNNDLYNLAVAVSHRGVDDEDYDKNAPLPKIRYEGMEIYPDVIEAAIEDSTTVDNPLIRINYAVDSLHPFLDNASPLRKNLVILYGESKAFMMDAMNRLNEQRDTFNIQLVGMPDVERFSNLDDRQSNNMNLTWFSSYYLDYNSPETLDFVRAFRENYATDPDVYGFTGYDVTRYFLYALYNLDNRFFDCLQAVPLNLLMTRYRFEKIKDTGNYENSYWNLLRYQNLELIKLPGPLPGNKQEK